MWSMADCLGYLGAMFGGSAGVISADALNVVLRYLPLMLLACVAATPLAGNLWKRIRSERLSGCAEIALCMLGLMLCTAVLASQSYNPFLYFKF